MITKLLHENRYLVDQIQELRLNNKASTTDSIIEELPLVLKKMIEVADKNYQKAPARRRHDTLIKKFATSLFLYSGSIAYKFIQSNLSIVLPSIRTVQTLIHKEYKTINEGEFRFDELLSNLQKHNAELLVSIGEDATRVVSRMGRCKSWTLDSWTWTWTWTWT